MEELNTEAPLPDYESEPDKLSASEAIFGFMAWLTTRKEIVTFGSNQNCAPAVELIEEFCKVNRLSKPTDTWPNNLIHPSGECSQINLDKASAIATSAATDVLRAAFKNDPAYAYGWHANIAMACYDSMPEIASADDAAHGEQLRIGNEAASRFMKLAFSVETSGTMLDDVPKRELNEAATTKESCDPHPVCDCGH